MKQCTVAAASGVGLTTSQVTVTGDADAPNSVGSPVKVDVAFPYTYRSPLAGMLHSLTGATVPPLTLNASAQLRLEDATVTTTC